MSILRKSNIINLIVISLNKANNIIPIKNTFEHIVGINFDSADVNGDGEINIADVNCCIDTIIDNNDTFDEVYDVNGDGEINIADINAIIAAILDGE